MTPKVPGITLDLAGERYVVPPLSLGAIEDLQERLAAYRGAGDAASFGTAIDALHRALLRNYPEITRDQARELIGLENMEEVMLAVMDVSGLRRREIEAGEAAAKTMGPSTSPNSTAT